jgi:uncharacterized protein (DUF1330 family)
LSLVAGAVLGAGIIQGLHAQAKPPVYTVSLIQVTNPDAYANQYLPPARASIKAHGGVLLAAGPGTTIDGTLPKDARWVIYRWESLDVVKAWFNSPEYVAAHKIGVEYAKYNIVAVDGAP